MDKDYFQQDHLTEEMIALYAEKLQTSETQDLPEEVKNHIEDCFECKEAVMDVYAMMITPADTSPIPHETIHASIPVASSKASWKTIFYSASLILAFFALIFIKQIDFGSGHMFKADPMYEHYIENTYRSEMTTIEVITPDIGEMINSETLTFHWDYDPPTILTITILNNQQEVMLKSNCESDGVTFPNTLSNGLYYWKLETESDLIYIRKFIVKK